MNLTQKQVILPVCLIVVFVIGLVVCGLQPHRGRAVGYDPGPPETVPVPRVQNPVLPPGTNAPVFPPTPKHVTPFVQNVRFTPEQVVDAIFWTEGGPKTTYPYGILGFGVLDNKAARRICLNTVNNTFDRWIYADQPGPFIYFLANRYCPESVDPIGYANWIVNIKWFLVHPRPALP